jgi:cyclopropane fatty-acyl-phospholipid synthase-like methyltransferase
MNNSWQSDDKRIVNYYEDLLANNGANYKAVDWGSAQSQALRFNALLEGIKHTTSQSLLDVGCGVGDLLAYLQENNLNYQYLGIDITPSMITSCKQRFPNANFSVANILNTNERTQLGCFDAVMASGLFNLRQEQPFKYMKTMLKTLWQMTSKVLVFNSISLFNHNTAESNDFAANPLQTIEFCRQELTSRFVLRHDYHKHDFSVYLYKEQ